MVKTLLTVYVEQDTILKFKEYAGKGKVSSEIESLMNHVIQNRSGVVSWNDMEQMKKEKEDLKDRLDKDAMRLREIELKEAVINEEITQKETERRAKEEEEKENAAKCAQCKNVVQEKGHYAVKEGFICRSCFMNLTGEQAKQLGL